MDSIRIEQAAADWLIRRDSGTWSAADQAAFDEWLEPTAHRVAYIRLAAAWRETQRLQALGAGTAPGELPRPNEWRLTPFFSPRRQIGSRAAGFRPPPVRLALVASLLIAILLGSAWFLLPRGDSYHTAVGGTQGVPMADGSKVTLNTDSRIRVQLTARERRVQLEQGEAFFEVAKDATRPFVVAAGTERVVAVGTQFSVRRDERGVRVVVTEGTVRIEHGDGAMTEATPAMIEAGSIARIAGEGVLIQEKPRDEVERYLSWRTGYLVFRETPLADAVAEFNRYTTQRIVIEDAQLAGVRIGGNFKSTNVDAFVRLLEEGFQITATRTDGVIALRAPRQ